jgi:tetratricopeptide (TPR) repeat protein
VAGREGLPLANADAAFAAASPDGIPGGNLLVDYCHPTPAGHQLWAACIAGVMREHGCLAPTEAWVSADQAIQAAEAAALEELPEDDDLAAQAAFAEGTRAVQAGRYEEALAHYTRVIELNPANYDGYYNRGLQYQRLGQPAAARADYERAITLRPDHYQALGNLGSVLIELGQPDAALEILEQALEVNPDYVRALVNTGQAYRLLDQPAHAREALDRAVRLAPEDVNARLVRGILRLDRGDTRGGEEDLRAVLRLAPGHPQATELLRQLGR